MFPPVFVFILLYHILHYCVYFFSIAPKLFEHLHEVDEKSQEILDQFIDAAEKNAPDKATQQMAWVGHMNNAKACAEEIILSEIIYI